jgi:hypothetical protein
MMSLICAEIIFLIIIHAWPDLNQPQRTFTDSFREEVIFVENAIVTRQTSAPPAPPKQILPVPVPNDEIIEEEIDFPDPDDLITPFDADGEEGFSEAQGEGEFVGSPERPPGLVRIVEPTVPDAAKRANIKAQIIVNFLVGANGDVIETYISEIRVYEGDEYKVVDQIGYGLMEAVMEAAQKWRFTAARDQGQPVQTYVENSFNIGF